MNAALGFGLLCLLSSDPSTSTAITSLSSKSFRIREHATSRLASQMPGVRLQVTVAASCGADPETRSRAARILADWRPSLAYQLAWWRTVWPAKSRFPHFDMIDSRHRFAHITLPACDVPDYFGYGCRDTLFAHYFNQPDCSLCGPDYHNFRTASLRYCRDMMYAGHEPGAVRGWLEGMARLEREWYRVYSVAMPD